MSCKRKLLEIETPSSSSNTISDIEKSRFVYECDIVPSDFWKDNKNKLCCWLDGEEFKGSIYSYPVRKEHNKWIVRGVFCSLHCVKRYIVDNCFMNTSVYTLFSLMCIQIYGVQGDIVPAPQYQLLKKFCVYPDRGMTVTQFRNVGPEKRSIRLVHPPIYPFKFPTTYICEQNIEMEQKVKKSEGFYIIHESEDRVEHADINTGTKKQKLSGKTEKIEKSKFPSRGLSNLNSFYPGVKQQTNVEDIDNNVYQNTSDDDCDFVELDDDDDDE